MIGTQIKSLATLGAALYFLISPFLFAADKPAPSVGLRLPAIFSDNMVLQADTMVPVWGWADPGETVTVSVAGQTVTAKADEKEKWKATLAPMQVAENLTFTVKGTSATSTVTNVLVGEVWFASGLSKRAMARCSTTR